ncbi:DJ-1 family glyoxalase III [Thermodesulfatator autotrophicus]|uniref:Thiamine biosynthesis protein ThiJ n=1 Tax=Thermodesulfatator autotrophicus TaxID=1795632 RepID=A0A177E5Z6_9BACT|nr:DJ-1 family glyoxalase III [Thermodesulfatator autotrophicus]OAG27364.1 thiamine biosynthesis protein ThiJ [Thermodesulfatator autotrophicus]
MAKVAILLAPGYEELEAVTVIDVLRRGGVDLVIAGLEDAPIPSARNVKIVPDTTVDQLSPDELDMVILPGGLPGVENLKKDSRVKDLIQKMQEKGKKCAAICAAPGALAAFGVLKGKKATIYPSLKNELKEAKPEDAPVVVDENIITSQGPGTAMPFAFTLLALLAGEEKAKEVAKQMLVNWP